MDPVEQELKNRVLKFERMSQNKQSTGSFKNKDITANSPDAFSPTKARAGFGYSGVTDHERSRKMTS